MLFVKSQVLFGSKLIYAPPITCVYGHVWPQEYISPYLSSIVQSPDEMYAEALDYPWHELFDLDKTFAVRAVATRAWFVIPNIWHYA
jgi:hypothetical protein